MTAYACEAVLVVVANDEQAAAELLAESGFAGRTLIGSVLVNTLGPLEPLAEPSDG